MESLPRTTPTTGSQVQETFTVDDIAGFRKAGRNVVQRDLSLEIPETVALRQAIEDVKGTCRIGNTKLPSCEVR